MEETLQSKYSPGISCINMPDSIAEGGREGEERKKKCKEEEGALCRGAAVQYVTTGACFDAMVGAVR